MRGSLDILDVRTVASHGNEFIKDMNANRAPSFATIAKEGDLCESSNEPLKFALETFLKQLKAE
jgi:F0F1-type ATP synthase alpha subunit